MKEHLIERYLGDQEIYDIIGHDLLVYIGIVLRYLVLLALVFTLHYAISRFMLGHAYIDWGASLLGIAIYVKGTYDMANEYLDSLVITNQGLVLFKWDGLFNYTTDYFQWVAIDSISEEHNSFRDTLFKKGDLKIRLEDEKFFFTDISNPAEKLTQILHRKDKILGRYQYHENETAEDDLKSKYELLVEALGEVVTEYVEKKQDAV